MRLSKELIPTKIDIPGAKARQLSDFGTAYGVLGVEYFSMGAGVDLAPREFPIREVVNVAVRREGRDQCGANSCPTRSHCCLLVPGT